ncbi:MAG: UvrD-helicase domain-containing protein, partial [Arenimonas sp.]
MDLAPIHTIHGFCQRALAEHALLAGQPLAVPETIANEAELRREVALEFWRHASRDELDAAALARVWKSPDKLADALPGLLRPDRLEPAPVEIDEMAADAALRRARGALAEAYASHGIQAREALRAACAGKRVNARVSKDAAVDPVWTALAAWHADPLERDPATDKLAKYGQSALDACANKNQVAPKSLLFAAIENWAGAVADRDATRQAACIRVVHAARDFAATRLASLKRERGLIGFDDMIAAVAGALRGPGGDAFAAALRHQYAVALVDEFQDTDARQWSIFQRLFAVPEADAGPRALMLVGDPKQAIYRFRGGDVDTYLAARTQAAGIDTLRHNFRSRPLALRAVATLFGLGGATGAFAQAGIDFIEVETGGACADDAWQRDGEAMPGVVVQALDLEPDTTVDVARAQAAARAAAAIADLLAAGRDGRALMRPEHGELRPPAPRDVTVLVPKHKDALLMQQSLAAAGVASVAAGRASLYGTGEARDLLAWLAAVRAPADDGRLRAMLATTMFGLDAAGLAALDTDPTALRDWQQRLQQWQQQARRLGPLAVLSTACAAQAPRLLALPDGERRLGNLLHLAEELQLAHAQQPGFAALQAELERRIADHDDADDAEQLRLESDADCVRILTLHASKGLTLDLVFVPFAALPPGNGRVPAPPRAMVGDGLDRVAVLFPDKGDPRVAADQAAAHAEAVRTLYVALTRARLATWVGWGAGKQAAQSALGWLLHRAGDAAPGKLTPDAVAARLRDWLALAAESVVVESPSDAATTTTSARAPTEASPIPLARVARRVLDRDWWVYS